MEVKRLSSHSRRMLGIAGLVLMVMVGPRTANGDSTAVPMSRQPKRAIVDASDRVQSSLVDAETGQRGFLLTGEDRYLEPYRGAVQELPGELSALDGLLAQHPGESQNIGQLNALTNRKLAELRQTIELRRAQGAAPALDLVLSGQGQRTMDAIRALCAQIKRNENARQVLASANGEAAAGIALLITVAGSLVLLFLFAVGFEPFASPDPRAWQRSWLSRYGAAILAVAAIALLRGALTPLIGPTSFPFTLFFCSVMFAAWFGGFRPAVLATALSLLTGAWFFAAPTGSLRVSGRDDQVAMLLIVLVGFGTALLSRSQRGAVDRALRAENAENNERQRFETTLKSIGDAVVATDAEGRVTFANKIASALLRQPEAEVRGKALNDVFRIVNEFTRAIVESPVARVLREGKIVGLANHTVLIAQDGTEVPIDDSAAPIRDAQGEMLGVVIVFRDITEKRAAEKLQAAQTAELRRECQRLGLALAVGRMGVFEIDLTDGCAHWWSPEAYALFGMTPNDFTPTRESLAALIHPPDREQFLLYYDENISEHEDLNQEFRILKPDGKECWIGCQAQAQSDEAGQAVRYSGIFLDITARKQSEQMLLKWEKLTSAARLSAALAHEINNPLNAVVNLLYLAKGASGVPAPIAEQLELAEEELERVAHAARQALGFYRESAVAEQVDIPALIDSMLKVFSSKIAAKRIKIDRKFVKCKPVYGVRGELRQVVSNLIANAIDAVSEGGAIAVETRPNKESIVEITIADDGPGIAAQNIDRIFEPFFTTKVGTGTGLGLWVAKEIVERHGGTIALFSQNGYRDMHGATFTVKIPAASITA